MAGRSDLTAITRTGPAAPVRWLHAQGWLPIGEAGTADDTGRDYTYLDLGCGKGADLDWLLSEGHDAEGYDPAHRPDDGALEYHYDVVLCTFVANVLSRDERSDLLATILGCLRRDGTAFVTVRRDVPAEGHWTSRGTWQESPDLRAEWDIPSLSSVRLLRETADYAIYSIH